MLQLTVNRTCRKRRTKTFHEQTKPSPMKFFKCGEQGYMAKIFRMQRKYNPTPENGSEGTTKYFEEEILEKYFSFIQTTENNLAIVLVLDSGVTSLMFKDESSFLDIDKKFLGTIANANSSKSLIIGKGTVEIRVLDFNSSE